MKFEIVDNPIIPLNSFVKCTQMGNITEIQHNTHKNTKANIQRLNKETLVVISTGEVRQVVHAYERSDDMKSVARSLKNLRSIINTNTVNIENVLWCTLTYAENMTDPKRLYDDFRKFNMRLSYYVRRNFAIKYDYIVVAEPQGRGAWHMHLLLIFQEKAPFIPHDDFWKLWSKQGYLASFDGCGYDFVKIGSLDKSCDNIGAYLTAYLGDMSLEDYNKAKPNNHFQGDVIEKEVVENGRKTKKKFLKGARLHFYPAGFRIFRCSRGIKRPTVEEMTYSEAMKKVRAVTLTFKKSVRIDDFNGYNTTITTYYYNSAVYDKKMKRINSIIIFVQILSRGFEENERFTDNNDFRVYDEYSRQVREQADCDKGGAVLSWLSS